MPIILDENQTIEEQKEQIQHIVASNKQVDAKYFSKYLTGNGKRKTGLFAIDSDKIDDFIQNKRRLLEIPENFSNTVSQDDFDDETFGNHFVKKPQEKAQEFKEFENILTTMIPPVLLFKTLTNPFCDLAFTFPRKIGMYNLNAYDTNWLKITDGTIDNQPATVYAMPIVQSFRLFSRDNKKTAQAGTTDPQIVGQPDIYVAFLTVLDNMPKENDIIITNKIKKEINNHQGILSIYPLFEKDNISYDYDQLTKYLNSHLSLIKNTVKNLQGVTPDQLKAIIGEQSLSEILRSQAMTLTHQGPKTLYTFIEVFAKRVKQILAKNSNNQTSKNNLINRILKDTLIKALIAFTQQLDLLNEYEDNLITTELLAEIYDVLKQNIPLQRDIDRIARHSLRLLLSQRLNELNELKHNGQLYQFEPKNDVVYQAMMANPNYSLQQKNIITTTEPLVIGQAGAGSGKSHTLVGRINYLEQQGEDLSRVLVLSFTNVAANNIKQRFPKVRSETLANMFHTIYTNTFPTQTLSQPSTVANSLRLLNPASPYFQNLGLNDKDVKIMIDSLSDHLERFDQSGFKRVNLQHELKLLSNLIEENLDITIHLLNAVEQTTLEIEPIIIHHMLLKGNRQLNVPKEYQELNYIITDESQDISTFEYILLLELVIHHHAQLLIIGDGSQTLYEFRNSDPRYMNALESSNVFVSHKLETNYRSRQEILTFANQFLQVIDANKFAKIQLTSSAFTQPTVQSFKEAVTIENNELYGTSLKDYTESIQNFFEQSKTFEKWFIERVRKGEQVAIMGWTRREVLDASECLREILNRHNLGHIPITNIMSNNQPPMTILSRFAHTKQTEIKQAVPSNPNYLAEIERHADDFIKNTFTRSPGAQKTFYMDFIMRNIRKVVTSNEWLAWVRDYTNGKLNTHQVGGFLIQQLLRLETRHNAIEQYVKKKKDVPDYSKCPIILSTIHGTKGLEFDHTVVLFNESKRGSTSQESLRMLFVALSRAKKSEFIINTHLPSKLRSVSDTLSSMFQTPMETAYLRSIRDIQDAQQGVQGGSNQSATQTP